MSSRAHHLTRMARGVTATTTAVAAAITLAPGSAHAVATSPITATSRACGSITFTNADRTYAGFVVPDDRTDIARNEIIVGQGASRTITGLPGGRYAWRGHHSQADQRDRYDGWVTVATCAGGRKRAVEGDENGDGKADVLAIRTNGDLVFYRSTGSVLAGGVKVGHGFNATVMAKRLKEVGGPGKANQLVTLRNDGTLWAYPTVANGAVRSGRQVASGLGGYQHYFITPKNTWMAWGTYVLVGTRDGVMTVLGEVTASGFSKSGATVREPNAAGRATYTPLVRTDGRGESTVMTTTSRGDLQACHYGRPGFMMGIACSTTILGHGWGTMQIMSSPGSMDGDSYSDLVTRKNDGHLYRYSGNGSGSVRSGVRIGTNWTSIKLLA